MSQFGYVLYRLIDFYELLIVVECIMSWFPMGSGLLSDVYSVLQRLTEPVVGIFRKLIPAVGGGGVRVDFSPMIAILALDLIKRIVIRI